MDAVCEDPNPSRKQMERRCKQLVQRLQMAREGHNPPPLEDWMRQVYNRAATRRSMDGLVHALRAVLQHIEQLLEHHFSGSGKPKTLETASERLAQADGIFAMLEMEQAHLAVRHMREQLKALITGPAPDATQAAQTQSQWASTLGALGFLTNMLAFQPSLAKEMFQFDAANGQLASALLPHQAGPSQGPRTPEFPATHEQVPPGITDDPEPAAITPQGDNSDGSVLATFIEEARGVISQALQAVESASEPGDATRPRQEAHTIRRAFHTLKGGARMVGLDAMGESAWAFEELFNAHLAQGAALYPDLLELARQALTGFGAWMDAVARGKPVHWDVTDFRASADAMRLQGLLRPLGQGQPLDRSLPAMRVVGHVRLSEKLFQVFTAEAADHVAQLRDHCAQWNADEDARHLESIAALAHTLQGSASTVGFKGLATLARALEAAVQQLGRGWRGPQPGQQVLDSVHEMDRLLRCFGDGDLEEPGANVLAVLQLLAMPGQDQDHPNGTGSAAVQTAPQADPGTGHTHAGTPIDTDLWQVFQEEAQELLPALGLALRTWHAEPGSISAPAPVRRILHTLKGSARLAGAHRLGHMAHEMESSLASIPDGEAALTALAGALDALDAIQSEWDQQCAAMATVRTAPETGPLASGTRGAPFSSAAPPRAAQSLRVRAQHVDRLLDQSSEVLLVRSRMQARTEHMLAALDVMALNAARLRDQLRELEMESDLQMQSRSTLPHDDAQRLDPLELDRFTRLHEITRMMAESTDDLGSVQKLMRTGLAELDRELALQNRHCRELQHGVLTMRLVAFDDISDRLYAVVRQSAKQVGTRVRLDIAGGALEIDRSVLDRIAPCLEHVLRNAVVHGIEPACDRLAAGKTESGTVWITVAQNDREIRIGIRDDGGGLRKDRVRAKAVALGLLEPDAQLSEAQALALLVQPGFSTSDGVTELAGRGVGMDVVQSEVHALGGRLSIESEDGKGMCFSMVFPLTTALAHVALFRIGDMTFGVPGNLLEQCVPRHAMAGPTASNPAQGVPLAGGAEAEPFWAGDLLEGPDPRSGRDPGSDTIAVFRSAGRTVALQVDQALGSREMIIKNLGPQLESMPGLVAISLLPQGDLVLIYNPIALAAVYGGYARARQDQRALDWQSGKLPSGPRSAQESTVLVVDDSITMRRVTERLLSHAGWRVVLASDGLDALEKLETTEPALILTDIEMPRMDGFDLVRQIRAQASTANTPVIIISSRVGQKHRDIAAKLGVQHYLGKPYAEAELLELVRSYCAPVSAPAL
jgi:chemosensory pili system protein ChpA (sensor histidine kinase/response regulator)